MSKECILPFQKWPRASGLCSVALVRAPLLVCWWPPPPHQPLAPAALIHAQRTLCEVQQLLWVPQHLFSPTDASSRHWESAKALHMSSPLDVLMHHRAPDTALPGHMGVLLWQDFRPNRITMLASIIQQEPSWSAFACKTDNEMECQRTMKFGSFTKVAAKCTPKR